MAAVVRVAARGACEVKAPLQPRSSKCGPVAAAGAAPCWDAYLMLDSLLQTQCESITVLYARLTIYLTENATSSL